MGSYNYASINAFNLYALVGGNWANNLVNFLFLNYKTWGIIFLVIICAAIFILQWKTREQRPYFDLSAFLIISVFMLVTMMHERYIVPACILLVFAYAYSRDLSTLFFACAFSMTALVNQMVVLFADSSRTPDLSTMALSAVNMALYIAYAIITVKKFSSGKVLIKSPGLLG
jgi:Gpi18-like mannosyltransferase